MKEALREVMSQFYTDGVPTDAIGRQGRFPEVRNNATVVKGMRRTGKTYFTYLRMRELLASGIPLERIVHINFDDERLAAMTSEDLHWVVDLHSEMFPAAADEKCYYFLDELQNISGWERFARRLIDSHRIQLCLTGSSSRMLSQDIATEMRGRSADYMAVGGFPDVQKADATTRIMMLQSYAEAVIYRDIIERHEIASVQALKYVLQYLLHNFARKISVRAISGVLRQLSLPSDREALSNYLSYYSDSYFAYPVPLRTDSLAVRRTNPDKYYLVDTGMIGALKAKNDAEKGFLLENAVFMELRRGFNKIEYFVTKKGEEVDFFVTDKVTKEMRLVQVSYEMPKGQTREREISALRNARTETGIRKCEIVTWDEEGEEDGIRIVPAWKWFIAK